MAKQLVFSVYDSKVLQYARPFFCLTRGEAVRLWEDTVNDPQTTIFRHPHDFALMELGEYDEAAGTFTNREVPLSLGLAVQAKRDHIPSGLTHDNHGPVVPSQLDIEDAILRKGAN